jgi:hypothetical protein
MGADLSLQALKWKAANVAMLNAFYEENRRGDPGKVDA